MGMLGGPPPSRRDAVAGPGPWGHPSGRDDHAEGLQAPHLHPAVLPDEGAAPRCAPRGLIPFYQRYYVQMCTPPPPE